MNILQPKIVIGVSAIVILLILSSLAQEMNRRWQIQKQVQELEQEVRAMHKNVVELENLNKYFNTDDYQERLAREKLNYKAEGEQVVLITDEVIEKEEVAKRDEDKKTELSIPMRWWHIFFVDDRV